MSDLISRSALIEILSKYKFGAIESDSVREYIKEVVLDFVREQPIAYDAEKVEIEIRHCSGKGYRDIDGDYVPPMIETDTVIELVRKGGAE